MKTDRTVVASGNRLGLYDLLQVAPRATDPVIHAAYRVLARSYHPDHNHTEAAETLMRELNAAYAVLSDPRRRARYDARLARSGRLPTPRGQPFAASAMDQAHASRLLSHPSVASTKMGPPARGVIAAVLILATIALITALLWLAYDEADSSVFGPVGITRAPVPSTTSQLMVNSSPSSSTHNGAYTLGVA